MLTDREKEQLLERQSRVYEVADMATKPAQWFIGGAKAVFLLLVFAGVCIVGPIYYFLHGGSFSSFQFGVGCWILGLLVMFFGAPFYTLFWGAMIFFSLNWWNINKNDASGNLFIAVLWLYEGVGLLWVAAKIVRWAKHRREQQDFFNYSQTETAVTSFACDEPQQPPATDELRPDSLLPEDVQQILRDKLQSIIAVSEAVPERQRATQSMLALTAIETVPLSEAMRSAKEMLASVNERMKELVALSSSWGVDTDRDEAKRQVGESLRMQQAVEEQMTALLRRLKREEAPYPIAEVEETLNQLRAGGAYMRQTAAEKGLL